MARHLLPRTNRAFKVSRFLAIGTLLLLPTALFACLWDHDTLMQERARFPGTLELITGRFLRHSRDFYEWRIQDRLKRLENDPANPVLLDDLAVAYQKTGESEKAIETMERKESLTPGLYETYANLGTFYILDRKYENGLLYIDKALAINPNAHFGREKYQKLLVEYVLLKRSLADRGFVLDGFGHYLATQAGTTTLSESQVREAIVAVQGMMRFADHENPILLEALADLLTYDENPTFDAKLLACRCYLKMWGQSKGPDPYRDLAQQTLTHQTKWANSDQPISLSEVERNFEAELFEASVWSADLRVKEVKWIQQGKNPDEEFDRLYSADPESPSSTTENQPTNWQIKILPFLFALWLVPLLLALFLIYRRRRQSGSTSQAVNIEP